MLHLLTFILLLANIVYFAWSEGKLPGLAPEQQTESQRLGQQLRPNALRLLSQQELRQFDAVPVASRSTECLQAGLFSDAQSAQLRPVLASTLAPETWTLTPAVEPARWIVYMGKYASPEALAKKRAELASFNLHFEALQSPALQWGLSLGGYETQADASTALAALNRRGIRTARVLQEREEARGNRLRLAMTGDALRASLPALKPALGDKVLLACK